MLTVTRLARAAGVKPDTVRFYEREGLLEARRAANGYRVYDDDALRRLRFIRGSQRLGLRLREIRGLLDVIDRGLCPCGHARELVDARIEEIDRQLEELQGMRRELTRLAEDVTPDSCTVGVWPCEDRFVKVGGGERDA